LPKKSLNQETTEPVALGGAKSRCAPDATLPGAGVRPDRACTAAGKAVRPS